LPVLALFLLTSCNSGGCYESTSVKVYCTLHSLLQNKDVKMDSISVWGAGSDSLVYNNESLSELELDLNPNAQETKYVVQIKTDGNLYKDTLSLKHTNQPWFQSMECGCMVFSTLDTCLTTGTIFQSANIVNHQVNNQQTENVVLNFNE